ncbi:MAG: ATP-binding cassette domain-containing protein [Planctomycetota bacterium]
MIAITDLVKAYGAAPVLDIPVFTFEAGQVHAVNGANGAGKTTLLRLIAGLEPPSAGTIITEASPEETVLCFQNPYLFRDTVLGNITYGLRVRRIDNGAGLARAAARALGLEHLLGRRARTLSAGERQKTALARAFVLKPRLLLLDEPLANLDPVSTAQVLEALAGLRADGTTMLVVTHSLAALMPITDRVVKLDRGRLAPDTARTIIAGTVTITDGHTMLQTGGGVALRVVTDKRGPARGILSPTDVILSAETFPSSMQNAFRGIVTGMAEAGGVVSVTVDIGLPVTAHITPEAGQSLGLAAGRPVWVMFKATAVEVY